MAKTMRGLLLATAKRRETITYGVLMSKFRLSRGRVLTETIAAADRLEYRLGAPGFAALVVRKDTGFPGGGYFCDGSLPSGLRRRRGRSGDPRLSDAEKQHITKQRGRIWNWYAEPYVADSGD